MTRATISPMEPTKWFGNIAELEHSGDESHLILEILNTSKALLSAFSHGTGIPVSQMVFMRILAGVGHEGVGVLDIARMMGVNGAAVTRKVKQMEQRGLVLRRSDRHDGRKSYIRLSAKGRRQFQEVHQRLHAFEDFLGTSLGKEEIETTKRVLSHLRTVLDKTR